MKTTMNVKSVMVLLMMSMLTVTASAQRLHKHPRITIKANRVELNKSNGKEADKVILPATVSVIQEENAAKAETETQVNELAVATDESTDGVVSVRKNIVKSAFVKDAKRALDFTTFSQQLTEHNLLMKVKEVEKTALARWIMIMIILLALAFLFMILAVIFEFYVSWVLSTIFWIFSSLLWVGAIIVLILGLVGVMS